MKIHEIKKLSMVLSAVKLSSMLVGCNFLPQSGPSDISIRTGSGKEQKGKINYRLLPVDATAITVLQRHSPIPSYRSANERKVMDMFPKRGIEELQLGDYQVISAGDVLQVSIYEAGGGLFHPTDGANVGGGTPMTNLPPQAIDQTGEIKVPYAGCVRALGRRPRELEAEITELLKGKAIDPQVIVTITQRDGGNLVSVSGDVKTPKQVPVSLAGTRLIDAVTAAGGATARPHEVMVVGTRKGVSRSDTLQSVYDNTAKNVTLEPGDTIILRNVSPNYMVFGAGGTVGMMPIDVEDLTLAQAMAKTGGASDNRADPSAVYLYRDESSSVINSINPDEVGKISEGQTAPVIYLLDLSQPEGFFLASRFNIRDRDIVYYANAKSVGVSKFVSLINNLLLPTRYNVFNQ